MKKAFELVIRLTNQTTQAIVTRGTTVCQKAIVNSKKANSQIQDLDLLKETHSIFCSTMFFPLLLQKNQVRLLSEYFKQSYGLFYHINIFAQVWSEGKIRGRAQKIQVQETSQQRIIRIDSDKKQVFNLQQEFYNSNQLQLYLEKKGIKSRVYIQSQLKEKKGICLVLIGEDPQRKLQKQLLKYYHQEIPTGLQIEGMETQSFEYSFQCDCTREKVQSFLGSNQVEDLIQMKQNNTYIRCHRCNQQYQFTPTDIEDLLKKFYPF